jgi:hypothetical protein
LHLEEQASFGVEHHGGEEKREVNDGGAEEIVGGTA